MTTYQDHHSHKRIKELPYVDQTTGLAVSLAKQPDSKMTTQDSWLGDGEDKFAFYEALPESHNTQLLLNSYSLQLIFF